MGVCITFHNFLKLIYARVHLSTCLTRLKFNSPTSLSSSSRHTMMTGVRTPNAYTLLFKKNNSNIFLFIFSWGLDWVSEQCILTIGIRSASRVLISAVVNTWVIVDGWSMCSAYYNRNGHSLEILGSTSLWSIVEWHTLDLMYCVNGFPVELSVCLCKHYTDSMILWIDQVSAGAPSWMTGDPIVKKYQFPHQFH